MKLNKIVVASASCLSYFVGAVTGCIIYDSYTSSQSDDRVKVDQKLEEIYTTLLEIGTYQYCAGDTQIRNLHYVKPHKTNNKLCPECADVHENKNTGSLDRIPKTRLAQLRKIESSGLSLPNPSEQSNSPRPDERLSVLEELDSILFLLKSQKSHMYTNMYTGELVYHYAKKHKHSGSGEHGKCPDCIKLRNKQTTPVSFITKEEHKRLLKLEKKFKNEQDSGKKRRASI